MKKVKRFVDKNEVMQKALDLQDEGWHNPNIVFHKDREERYFIIRVMAIDNFFLLREDGSFE